MAAHGEDDRTTPSSTTALTISEVARKTGISPATLRVWESRYGLIPSRTTAGGHRRYSSADVARLREVQRLISAGASSGEAARAVLATRSSGGLPQLVLAPGARPAAHQLAVASYHLDGPTCSALLREHLARDGVVAAWDHVLRPVLKAVGEQWLDLAHGVAVEHLLSHIATGVFAEGTRRRPAPGAPTAFLACAPGEMHDLPLVALGSALAPAEVTSTIFGARTPADTLIAATEQLRPSVVVVFSLLPDWADVHAVTGFGPDTAVLAAGPGWRATELPATVLHVDALLPAAQAITQLASRPVGRRPIPDLGPG